MSYTLVNRIKRTGYPTTSKKWKSSHLAQNKQDKKENPRLFKAVQRRINKMPSDELAGSHTKRGKILISSSFVNNFPKKMRGKVIRHIKKHEIGEHKRMNPKKRKSKK